MKQHLRLNPCRNPPVARSELLCLGDGRCVRGAVTALVPSSLGSLSLTPSSLFLGGSR